MYEMVVEQFRTVKPSESTLVDGVKSNAETSMCGKDTKFLGFSWG